MHFLPVHRLSLQLDFARQHIDYHMKKFELEKCNVEFIQGEIDELEKANLKENSIDVIVSNSVINYRRNRKAIIEGVCKLLKPGGEFYFSDVYVNRSIPEEYQELLSGEYVGGALRWEDLILYATEAGFTQPRLVTAKPVTIINEDILKAIGKARFVTAIFRCFKLPFNDNDTTQFNVPYQLTYETPLPSCEEEFFFDHLIQFKPGELLVVNDPSIALALNVSRYKDNFIFDPIEDTNMGTTTIETIEELQGSNDDQTKICLSYSFHLIDPYISIQRKINHYNKRSITLNTPSNNEKQTSTIQNNKLPFQFPPGKPNDQPTIEHLRYIENQLKQILPDFCKRMHPYALYTADMTFENYYQDPPKIIKGAGSYALSLFWIRLKLNFKLMNLTIQLLKTTIDEESNCVKIRWRISGLTNKSFIGVLKGWKQPRDVAGNIRDYVEYIDGLSTFYVRGDGRIYKHRVDRVTVDEDDEFTKKIMK
ncbi:unnamed protein product [Rotaria sordida]|uniref:Methyltransferase domain-containing protein n=1 Tax=Rotaria sordida TaxID=392033 RepID=A0A814FE48_9BILA|nr:unnamed protein product [Rotaria sordida]